MEKDGEKTAPKKEKDGEVAAPEQKEDNDAVVSEESVSKIMGEEVEPEEDDEDEDFDFDPFLQYTDEKDASSSLSSENEEGVEEEGKDQLEDVLYDENETTWLELGSDVEEDEFVGNYDDDDDEDIDEDGNTEDNNEEVIGNLDESTEDQQGCSNILGRLGVESDALVAKSSTLNSCDTPGKEEDTGNLTDKAEVELGETMDALPDLKSPRKSVIVQQRGESNDEDIEDAISKRTRARYSLADMSLDELETFLQESDEEDYFQNVDDEEEYRKFLAAVAGSLEGNNVHDQVSQNKEDDDEDDEDNDADFEIEIEEALESDDEIIIRNSRKRKHWENFSRPNTRERRRQRNSIENKDRLLGLAKTPLRPLLPLTESLQTQSRSLDRKNVMIGQSGYSEVHIENRNMLTGFTAHQIGQLHCLIHEHVQLLVQVFSLCVLDPSKQHIAIETQKMLNELVDKCDEVSSWKKNPYPEFCLHPPYIHPSVTESIQLHPMPLLSDLSNKATNAGDTLQRDMESGWIPAISGPIQSVLDVAPIRLVRDFFNDVDLAVQESRQQHVQIGEYQSKAQREPLFPFPAYKQPHFQIGECPSQFEQEPLFPLQSIDACSKAPKKLARGAISSGKGIVSTHPPQKKTMAAVMVENTKRQSVALVSKNIVNVVQRFFPLFNAALFPHKPPPAATANRVLFTDAEDELLAMGLMTYNNDWKAIKERFLPSKSANQIFVRQKNRASSRAPENAIKAVRRMKTSPLTAEEKICIHEGLRVLKYDWKKVWEYCVPYRDPNLLRRQWRVALGTQKSYRTKDDATKKKRRIYEAMRRRSKALQKGGCSLVGIQGEQGQQFENDDGEENSGDENPEDTDEAYVHEAFLADWKPYGSRLMAAIPQGPPLLGLNNHSFTLANSGSQREGSHNGRISSVQPNNFNPSMSEFQPLHQTSGGQITHISQLPSAVTASMQYSHPASLDYVRRPIRTQINLRPYRSRNKNKVQTVKLAPDLPTLNLPPSVRVIPQSMLMGHHCGGPQRLPIAQNKKANPPSTPVVADPRSHLQNSNDSTNRNFRADSSTVSATTTVSTSSAGLERNLSSESNILFNYQNYEKEMSRAHQKSRSTMNQEPKLFENEETPQMDTQANPERNETDVHLHPLLLQNSCEDSVFYQYNKYGTRAQIPFSTFHGNAHNSDFHSFFMPYQQNGMMKYAASYSPASVNKGAALSSSNADFHPLLQKNTEITEASSTVNTSLSLQQPCNSEGIGVLSTQAPLSNCISRPLACQTEIQEHNQLQERELPITYPASDANKMNFEKHSHTRDDMMTLTEEGNGILEPRTKGGNSRVLKRKQTFQSRKQITGQNALKQTIYNSKRRKNETNSNMQVHQPILNNSASYFHGVESVMESDPAIYMGMNHMKSSENIATSRDLNEDTHEISLKDDSLPGIVMEQEELSDSEDDIGDSVQFEYEEMGDSDRDYFAFEQQSNMLDKEDNSIEFEKEEIISEGDETEDECRVGDTVPCRPAGSSGAALSVSAAVSVSMHQNFVRNRSKKSKCWDSAVNSLDVKSKKKKQSCKRGVDKHQGETLQIGSRRKRRIEESQKNVDIQSRNILCMAPSTDAGIDGCARVFENETVLKMHSDSSVIHSEIAAQRNESCALNKEISNHQGPKDTEKTTIEAAQVLTGIHQNTTNEKSETQAS